MVWLILLAVYAVNGSATAFWLRRRTGPMERGQWALCFFGWPLVWLVAGADWYFRGRLGG